MSLSSEVRLEWVTLNVRASNNGASYIIFGGLAADRHAGAFLQWLDDVDGRSVPDAALQCALSSISNVCIKISWWNSLPAAAERQWLAMVPPEESIERDPRYLVPTTHSFGDSYSVVRLGSTSSA